MLKLRRWESDEGKLLLWSCLRDRQSVGRIIGTRTAARLAKVMLRRRAQHFVRGHRACQSGVPYWRPGAIVPGHRPRHRLPRQRNRASLIMFSSREFDTIV
jgi:hypothetical protein